MKNIGIQDYVVFVYLLGWAVVAIGVYIAINAGLSNTSADTGISVIIGGLYITLLVKNTLLKMRIIELEQELQEK